MQQHKHDFRSINYLNYIDKYIYIYLYIINKRLFFKNSLEYRDKCFFREIWIAK
jgi:hypothetical protein